MIETKRKEELSLSYLNAICAYTGIAMERQFHDEDSVDVLIKKIIDRVDGTRYNAQLSIQLKCTSQTLVEDDESISYSLKVKNYNDIRRPSVVQHLLFVLILPNKECDWVAHSIDELIIRRCMYWVSLKGMGDTQNTETVTVKLPKTQCVSSLALIDLLQRIAEEECI